MTSIAPHLLQIAGPPTEDVDAAIKKILAAGYLPRIYGGRATWSVVSNKPIAVVAEQWAEPRLLVLDVRAGQAAVARPGEWVRYSTPEPGGAEYIAVCTPAFSPDSVHRDRA